MGVSRSEARPLKRWYTLRKEEGKGGEFAVGKLAKPDGTGGALTQCFHCHHLCQLLWQQNHHQGLLQEEEEEQEEENDCEGIDGEPCCLLVLSQAKEKVSSLKESRQGRSA